MPEEFRDKLIEPFRQEDPSASRRFGGARLGLSITRNILNALSGRIDFESSPGTGTTASSNSRWPNPQRDGKHPAQLLREELHIASQNCYPMPKTP